VSGVLVLVTLIYAYPLLSHLTTSIPGIAKDHDVATMVWNVAWVRQALQQGKDLLHTDAVLIPFGADLRLHTYGLLQGLMAYPFTGWLGVVGAFNLILIVNLFFNGLALYALIYVETHQMLAALVAAVGAMLSSPMIFNFSVGRPSIAAIWIVVGTLLALHSLLDQPRPWKGFALGGLLIAALLSDLQILLYAGLWLAFYGLYRLARDRGRMLEGRRMMALVIAGVVFLLPFMLIFYPALTNADGYPQPTLDSMRLFSFRLEDFFTPETIPLIYSYELLAAAVAAPFLLRQHTGYRFWLISAVFFLILALGPYLQLISGDTHIPLPFALLSLWPPLRNFRTPYRMAMPAQIGLGAVGGLVWLAVFNRLHQWRPARSNLVSGVLAALVIGIQLLLTINHDPLLIQTYPTYTIYNQIAAEAGSFVVLEVPFGVRSGLDRIGHGGEILIYYQSIHGKRLLNGMSARLPASVFSAYRRHPSLLFLSGDTYLNNLSLDADFNEVLVWSAARYVLLHRSLLDRDSARRIETFLGRQPQLERIGVEDDLVIYRIQDRPGRES
jgi:hypothetical protein